MEKAVFEPHLACMPVGIEVYVGFAGCYALPRFTIREARISTRRGIVSLHTEHLSARDPLDIGELTLIAPYYPHFGW
jgi:hypothetical protein